MLKSEKNAAVEAASRHDSKVLVPFALKPAPAAAYVGLSRSRIYELIDARKVRSFKVGGARLVEIESLVTYIKSQPA